MSRRFFLVLLGAAFLLSTLLAPASAATGDLKAKANDFIAVKGNEAIQTFSVKNRTERYERFRVLLSESFAVDAIAKFVIGRHWNPASETQKARYLKQFQAYLLANYAARAWNVEGVKLNVRQIDLTEDGDAMVDTLIHIPHKEKQDVTLGFRVRDYPTGTRIVDLQVDGISLIVTHRADFTAKISQLGGNLDKFCDFLAERTRGLEDEADLAAQFEASQKVK
ncbi:MAG: ABC transporter substrate-binding protein [Alphaproteobacteria bacterium]|nr:ABC transporter substrate-binding protein [Alphaproteobacteria bacterium]